MFKKVSVETVNYYNYKLKYYKGLSIIFRVDAIINGKKNEGITKYRETLYLQNCSLSNKMRTNEFEYWTKTT